MFPHKMNSNTTHTIPHLLEFPTKAITQDYNQVFVQLSDLKIIFKPSKARLHIFIIKIILNYTDIPTLPLVVTPDGHHWSGDITTPV